MTINAFLRAKFNKQIQTKTHIYSRKNPDSDLCCIISVFTWSLCFVQTPGHMRNTKLVKSLVNRFLTYIMHFTIFVTRNHKKMDEMLNRQNICDERQNVSDLAVQRHLVDQQNQENLAVLYFH